MKKHHHYGHLLKSRISSGLWEALCERCEQTGESPDHVVTAALAHELNIDHHTLFQISTATALVEGIYNGCMTVAEIKKHGNFGLGTFDELDGEGIMLHGEVWQAKSDGTVAPAPDSALVPFWCATNFAADSTTILSEVHDWADLCRQIDTLRVSENIFTSICIQGVFKKIEYRVACRSEPGTDLVTATSNQAVFEIENCSGVLVGFWTPAYAKTLNVPGYHLHLISDDHKHAGHVLNLSGNEWQIQLTENHNLMLALPESTAFLQADLSRDPSIALAKAEGGHE